MTATITSQKALRIAFWDQAPGALHSRRKIMVLDKKETALIAKAIRVLEEHARYNEVFLGTPDVVKALVRLRVGGLEHEVFGVLWVDAQNRLIESEEVFRGTLTQTAVYPREVLKSALAHNAAAVVLYHNHPSGSAEPSRADEALTMVLKQALVLIDVRVLDHIIVTAGGCTSFAERGLL